MYYDIMETIKIVSDVLDLEYNYINNKKIYRYILKTMGLDYYALDEIILICKGLVDKNTSQKGLDNIVDLENNYMDLISDDGIYNLSEIHNL